MSILGIIILVILAAIILCVVISSSTPAARIARLKRAVETGPLLRWTDTIVSELGTNDRYASGELEITRVHRSGIDYYKTDTKVVWQRITVLETTNGHDEDWAGVSCFGYIPGEWEKLVRNLHTEAMEHYWRKRAQEELEERKRFGL